jgi:GT2 family glycosyltransferase
MATYSYLEPDIETADRQSVRRAPPALTVIIPTMDRFRYVTATVVQVLEQSYQDFELLVVDQSGAEAQKLEAFVSGLNDPRVIYMHLKRRGLANARNEGIRASRGSIVLFLDDDVLLLNRDFLAAHVNRFDDASIGAVSGRIVDRVTRPNYHRTACWVSVGGRTIDNMMGDERVWLKGLKGGNMSVRVAIFGTIGGFDRNFRGTALLEEADIATRISKAGWKLAFEPEAELLHLSAGGNRVTSEQEREWWRFRCTAYYVRKHRGLIGMLPFLLTFSAIAVKRALRWRNPHAVFYLLSAVPSALRAFRRGPDELLAELIDVARNA